MRSLLLVAAVVTLLPFGAGAQDAAEDDPDAVPAAEDLLSDDELDDLVAPVALYPDSLLTQVLVAATYPLDVMKADRFVDENPDVTGKERADLVQDEDWDESVRVLAGGFPEVLGRMADDIDWTEELGDAMLAQTDDLLDAVQRMRARAEATGNLTSNEAQTVEVEGDDISIAPADPEVVYVPAYDPATAYTMPPTAPAVVYDNPAVSVGDVVTTGAIAFGSALLVDEIFDDDDDWDDDWDDYWHGPRVIDWDDDEIFPRGDVDIEGDVNIEGNRVRIGDNDRSHDDNKAAWEADPERRDEARNKIADRKDNGRRGGGAAAATRVGVAGDGAGREDRRTQAETKLKARSGDGDGGGRVEKARADRRPAAAVGDHDRTKTSALKPSGSDRSKVAAARNRGATSLKHDRSPAAVKARAPSVSKPKQVARPKTPRLQAKAPPRKPAASSSAFHRPSGSASRSRAAAARGHKVGGGKRRR